MYVYKEIWNAAELPCKRDTDNAHDPFALLVEGLLGRVKLWRIIGFCQIHQSFPPSTFCARRTYN